MFVRGMIVKVAGARAGVGKLAAGRLQMTRWTFSARRLLCSPRQRRCPAQLLHDIAALDSAPEWTRDQIAGLVFGGLLVALYFSSKFIDDYAAASQRKQLGLCEKCGGLYDGSSCPERDCPEKARQS